VRALILIWLVLSVVGLLGGCGGGALSLLTGGGPKVAANVQAAKNASQTVGQTSFVEQRLIRPQARQIEQSSGDTQVRAESVRRVVVNEAPAWLFLVALAGWLLPTPSAIARAILRKMFTRKGAA